MNTINGIYLKETDSKEINPTPLFTTSTDNQINCVESGMKFSNSQTGSEIRRHWNINSLNILDRNNSAQHSEGEIGSPLRENMNEYMDSCINGSNNTHELFKTTNNNSASSELPHVSKPTIKILSNISNRYIVQTNDNLSKPSFNCSENFGDFCTIKCQEQPNKGLVNISNTYSKINSPNTLLSSANIRKDNCEKIVSRTLSPLNVIHNNNNKKNERPINVHIVRRNWNANDAGINNQITILDNNNSSQLNICRNLPEEKSRNQSRRFLFGEMNADQAYKGNIPVFTLQKKEQKSMLRQEKCEEYSSGSENVVRVHSFQAVPSSCKANSLSYDTSHLPTSGGDLLFTNINSEKELNENVEDGSKTNEMVESYNINPVVINKDILRRIQLFSVVHKKLKWSCSFCGESHATRLSLTTHVKFHLLPWCKICLKVVNSSEQLLAHMEKKHSTSDENVDQPDTQLVTSKYGRKRRVYSPATLLPKRRLDIRK